MTVIQAEPVMRPEIIPGLVHGLEVRFPPTLEPHQQRLLATLGVKVVFDPNAPDVCPGGKHSAQ